MSAQENESTVSVSLTVKDVNEALNFYTRAIDAKELYRIASPEGVVVHAEFMVGSSRMYISCESPEWHAYAMPKDVMASCCFSIATDNCDASYQKATAEGGDGLSEPQDQFWGMRTAVIKDPYGYRWAFRQIVEEVSQEEILRRAQELFGNME